MRLLEIYHFDSVKPLHPTVNSTLQVFMVFSKKLMNLCDILYFLRQFIIQIYKSSSYAFFAVNPRHN